MMDSILNIAEKSCGKAVEVLISGVRDKRQKKHEEMFEDNIEKELIDWDPQEDDAINHKEPNVLFLGWWCWFEFLSFVYFSVGLSMTDSVSKSASRRTKYID